MPAFAAAASAVCAPRAAVRVQAAPKVAAPKPASSFAAAALLSAVLLSAAPAMAGQGVTGGGIKTQVRGAVPSGVTRSVQSPVLRASASLQSYGPWIIRSAPSLAALSASGGSPSSLASVSALMAAAAPLAGLSLPYAPIL